MMRFPISRRKTEPSRKPSKPSPLLALPAELRAQILQLTLCTSGPLIVGRGKHANPLGRRRNVLLTCRQLYGEGKPICYGGNICTIIDDGYLEKKNVTKFLHIAGDAAQRIQEIRLLIRAEYQLPTANLARMHAWTKVGVKLVKGVNGQKLEVKRLSEAPAEGTLATRPGSRSQPPMKGLCVCRIRELARKERSIIGLMKRYAEMKVAPLYAEVRSCRECGLLVLV